MLIAMHAYQALHHLHSLDCKWCLHAKVFTEITCSNDAVWHYTSELHNKRMNNALLSVFHSAGFSCWLTSYPFAELDYMHKLWRFDV